MEQNLANNTVFDCDVERPSSLTWSPFWTEFTFTVAIELNNPKRMSVVRGSQGEVRERQIQNKEPIE